MTPAIRCWCGNPGLESFSADYFRCPACETLVLAKMPSPESLLVRDDESDYYGKHYFDRVAESHNLPPIGVRARADLPERCIYWMRSLLRYRLPPARILELGSSHGGFVAMMRWAGFDATGLDLSSSIVTEARRRFDVPILEGPVEIQNIAEGSLDAIVLMDVLEHLAAPLETLRHCVRLLKPDGLFFVQTPRYRERKALAEMEREGDPFLTMLLPDQHLFLFSQSSVNRLFGELGLDYVQFAPAIFGHYDMALVAGRTPLVESAESEVTARLEATPSGRLVLALHDLYQQFEDLTLRLTESETDRAARLGNTQKMERILADEVAANAAQTEARASEVGELKKRCELLRGAIERGEKQVNALTSAITTRDGPINELTAETSGRDGQINQLVSEITARDAKLKELVREIETRVGKLNGLASGIAERGRRLQAREIEIRDLRVRNLHLSEIEAVLERLQHSIIYRAMRRLGLWGWLDIHANDVPEASGALSADTADRKLSKVVVDLTPVLPGGGNGGAKVMTLELIRQLAHSAPDIEFVLLTLETSHDELALLDAPNVQRLCVQRPGTALGQADNLALRARSVLARFLPKSALDLLGRAYRQTTEVLPSTNSLVRRLDADLLFCPFTAPFYFDPSVPTVCVIYDLQHLYYPQFFGAAEIQERDRNLAKAARFANRLICISEYVRSTVLEKTTVSPECVETVHIQLPYRLKKPSVAERDRILQSLGVTFDGFLLYPANFWPHKNHELLLTAFGIYRASHPNSTLKLVLTGAPGDRQDFLQDAVRRMGISGSVLFPGYLSEDDLSSLLHSCMAIIFPSLFEGFGMPLLEGMAAGRPLLCSNNTALSEVAGDAALLFDPCKPAEIAAAIDRITSDAALRQDLVRRGAQRLTAFGGPKEMAASYLKVFRNSVQQPGGLPPGVYGAFKDGWVGERLTIVYGSGKGSRSIRLSLALPAWVPTPLLKLSLEAARTAPLTYNLKREDVLVIEYPVPPGRGVVVVSCSPSFRPSLCGRGADARSLACQLHAAEIIGTDGSRETLSNVAYEA